MILCVEDSKTQAMVLEKYLTEAGFKFCFAKDGKEAVDQLNKEKPQLVITDIQMPNMNGYELCTYIKNNDDLKDIPVMLLTSLSDPIDVIKGIECGANSFLTKPYSKELLLFHIENILMNIKLRKAEKKPTFYYAGQSYDVPLNPVQITDLLLSTYSSAIEKNRELNEANQQLSLLNQQKNQFLGMAAHDLRNPLGVIQGYSSILKEILQNYEDTDVQDMLNRIEHSSKVMLHLINDLLNISVIESGHLQLHLKKQDLKQCVKEVVAINQKLARNKKIIVETDIEESLPEVTFDRTKIEEVITNLITNAIKFSKPETKITISLKKESNQVILSVKDEGLGIPEEEQDKLFQSFAKLSVKGTAGESSTGLGLAIVKKVVTEHKGKIWLTSKPGVGTTFFVSLPL